MFRSPAAASPGYQVFMFALSVYALGILAFQAFNPSPSTRVILDYVDFAVCMVFLADFRVSLYRAPNRGRYFITWGWIDLLSSIPALDVVRWAQRRQDTLVLVPDSHRLAAHVEFCAGEFARFLQMLA